MTPTADALDRCLRLMLRGTPHPDDAPAWRDHIRQASIILDREQPKAEAPARSFWPIAVWATVIVILAFLAIGFAVSAARGQDSITWPNPFRDGLPSVLSLSPPSRPGSVAEVLFLNQDVHNFPSATVTLTRDTLTVSVTLEINRLGNSPDTITVTPPDGFIAIPQTLTVPEGETATIVIYPTTAATS